ncbi:hypothetical protein ACMD2_14772, partial [Ananas comosus]
MNTQLLKSHVLYKKTYHYKAKKHDDAITSVTYCCSKAGLSKSQIMRKVIAKIQKVAIRLKSNFLIDEVVVKRILY